MTSINLMFLIHNLSSLPTLSLSVASHPPRAGKVLGPKTLVGAIRLEKRYGNAGHNLMTFYRYSSENR